MLFYRVMMIAALSLAFSSTSIVSAAPGTDNQGQKPPKDPAPIVAKNKEKPPPQQQPDKKPPNNDKGSDQKGKP